MNRIKVRDKYSCRKWKKKKKKKKKKTSAETTGASLTHNVRVACFLMCPQRMLSCEVANLTNKVPYNVSADEIPFFFFFKLFFRENKTWYFIWITYLADCSHDMSTFFVSEKMQSLWCLFCPYLFLISLLSVPWEGWDPW